MTRIFILLLIVSACAAPHTTENKEEDSVATLSEDTLEMTEDGGYSEDRIIPADTVFVPVTVANKRSSSQVLDDIAYVYAKEGLAVYSDASWKNKIGRVAYKEKVKRRDGSIEFDNRTAFVDVEYLLPLPVPDTTDVLAYFLANTMLTKDPVERKSKEMDQEGSFSFIDYEFEEGFTVLTGSQYESGFTTVKLPGISIHQAFLFASYFYEDFPKTFERFPTEARDDILPEEKHIYVRVENGRVLAITVGNGEGCYWEDSIAVEDGGVVMNSSGGC